MPDEEWIKTLEDGKKRNSSTKNYRKTVCLSPRKGGMRLFIRPGDA